MKETMYTVDGQEVYIKEKAGSGYIGCFVFEYGDYEEPQFGAPQFFETKELYETPPVEKYNKEIAGLKQEINGLKQKRKEAQNELTNVNNERAKLKDFPIFNQAVKYLNGDYEYILYLGDFVIKNKSEGFQKKQIRAYHANDKKYLILYDSDYGYESDRDKAILVFDNIEGAQKEAEERIVDRINKITWESNLNNLMEKADKEVCNKQSVQDAIKSKRKQFTAEQKTSLEENVIKKKQELEKLENDLKKLQS